MKCTRLSREFAVVRTKMYTSTEDAHHLLSLAGTSSQRWPVAVQILRESMRMAEIGNCAGAPERRRTAGRNRCNIKIGDGKTRS